MTCTNRRMIAIWGLLLIVAWSPLELFAQPAQTDTPNATQRPANREAVKALKDLEYVPNGHERQRLDLYLPANPKADKLPLIVFIHGGAWRAGDKAGGRGQVQAAVASGEFVGASINYRLSGHAIWPEQIKDCQAAIRWLRGNAKKYGIDPERIGVIGSSAGGHLVAMLGTSGDDANYPDPIGEHTSESNRVSAVVDLYGPTNFLTMNDFPGRMDHDAPNSPESLLIGAPIQENPDKVRAASPLKYISKDDPPFLIIHGTDDPLVPMDQSVQLDRAFDEIGVESTLVRVNGGGHGGFQNPQIRTMILDFWKAKLNGGEWDVKDSEIENQVREN
ncbi:alpha/beta hydrolase [Thalassoglobus sp. JC818]|uniref:alpha/beta hydrolase n=1 Tax=Thalassoglobus sp. JC818 TaxID=3232136 RepID=UPI00345894D6